jgi:hypothetical protein
VATLVVLALLGTLAGLAPEASARGERRLVHVRLSPSSSTRTAQLARLGSLDVVGVDTAHGVADVRADAGEIAFLNAQGLEVSFAPPSDVGALAFDIEDYLTPERLAEAAEQLASTHPDLVRVFSIGKTHEGRDILALEVTARDRGPKLKPAALFNGMHHARELMTTEVVFDIARTLATAYGSDPWTTRLLDAHRVIVVPQVNPDGNAIVHSSQRFWRKNAWKDRGRLRGVDINRNYPALWNACRGSSGDKGSDTYRGAEAGSEPEVKAMMALVLEARPLVNISYHAYSEMIIHPYGCRGERNPAEALFRQVGERMRAGIVDDAGRNGTYALGAAPDVIYPADGTDVDWQWREAGVLSYAIEVGSSRQGFQPSYSQWRDVTVERQRGGWKALLDAMMEGMVTVVTDHARGPATAQIPTFDADQPGRVYPAREVDDGYAFLLPPGEHRITITDSEGRTETRAITASTPH